MALLFVDGFDHYATADITKKWSSAGGGATIVSNGGRRGTGCMRAAGSTSHLTRNVAAGASFVAGFALKVSSLPASVTPILALLDASTLQCDLRVNLDGTLSVTRNGTAVTGGTSVSAVTTGAWYYVEWKVTIADSIGASSCVVKVNGATWITVTTGQDVKNTTNASATQVRLGTSQTISANFDFDDFYLCDDSGSAPTNGFLGDCRVDALLPSGDGTYSEWTPSTGTAHAALVDENPPNTSDYVSSSTVNQRDTYAMADLAAVTGTIYGVQACAAVLKDDAGSRTAAPMIRSSGNDSVGPDLGLSTSQLYALGIWEKDPNGNATWTESAVNAAEVGVKVTA